MAAQRRGGRTPSAQERNAGRSTGSPGGQASSRTRYGDYQNDPRPADTRADKGGYPHIPGFGEGGHLGPPPGFGSWGEHGNARRAAETADLRAQAEELRKQGKLPEGAVLPGDPRLQAGGGPGQLSNQYYRPDGGQEAAPYWMLRPGAERVAQEYQANSHLGRPRTAEELRAIHFPGGQGGGGGQPMMGAAGPRPQPGPRQQGLQALAQAGVRPGQLDFLRGGQGGSPVGPQIMQQMGGPGGMMSLKGPMGGPPGGMGGPQAMQAMGGQMQSMMRPQIGGGFGANSGGAQQLGQLGQQMGGGFGANSGGAQPLSMANFLSAGPPPGFEQALRNGPIGPPQVPQDPTGMGPHFAPPQGMPGLPSGPPQAFGDMASVMPRAIMEGIGPMAGGQSTVRPNAGMYAGSPYADRWRQAFGG